MKPDNPWLGRGRKAVESRSVVFCCRLSLLKETAACTKNRERVLAHSSWGPGGGQLGLDVLV